MLHSPIGNAKSPASVGPNPIFDANQTIEIKPAHLKTANLRALPLDERRRRRIAPRSLARHAEAVVGGGLQPGSSFKTVWPPVPHQHAKRVPQQGQGSRATPI